MKFFPILLIAVVASCVTAPAPSLASVSKTVEIDTTASDVPHTDSLLRVAWRGPEMKKFPIVPVPIPESVRGFHLRAMFRVNERGEPTRISFSPPPDRRYARDLLKTLLQYEFRPAQDARGQASFGYYALTLDF
jgi:hypothetical protein